MKIIEKEKMTHDIKKKKQRNFGFGRD